MITIILASQSPRRKQLLETAGITFETITQDTDESYQPDLPIKDVPAHIALKKAKAVEAYVYKNLPLKYRELLIVAADTLVVHESKVYGKPNNRTEAIETLTKLQDNEHSVITGVAILFKGKEYIFSDTTRVVFHPLTEAQIAHYIDTHKPYDKAGAYAIQEWIGLVGVKEIHGDYYNIMGLPISRLMKQLKELDIL